MERTQEESRHREPLAALIGAASTFVAGIAIGSVVMYFLDPRAGAARRALARDRLSSTTSRSTHLAGKRLRHLRNQVQGLVASTATWLQTSAPAGDNKIAGRIRSRLGRITPHVHSIAVDVHEGVVTLSGQVPEADVSCVIDETKRTFGVREVINNLLRSEELKAEHAAQTCSTQS
jgi:hypothetical protein